MTSQPPVLDAMDISAETTTNITIDTQLLPEDTETPNESIDSILNDPNAPKAEKNKKERKNENISINLHSTDNKNDDAITRTIEHGAEIVFKNDRYTTPVTFEFYPAKRTNQINVFESHKKVFAAMKMMDNTTKIITKKGTVFDHPDSFPEGQAYLEHFPSINEVQRQRKVFVRCQVESSIMMSKFKFGEQSVMSALLENNTYMKYEKYNTHKEDSIGWLKYVNPVISLQRTTREKISDALMLVHLNEEEMKAMKNTSKEITDDPQRQNEILIPAFDIHHKTVGNGNGANRISTTAFDIRCNPKDSSLLKTLMARCSEDTNNDFTFIPYGLLQMTNAETYRRQIIFQNNFIASMAIIPIYGVTKAAMRDKVQEKLRQVAGISGIEETHLTMDKGKWLVVTNKACKNQVKKEVDRILREMTLKIITPEYNNQPGTISREHRNPTLVSYAAALQRETENGPTIKNVATPRQSKRPCVVLYGATNVFPPKRDNKRQNRTSIESTTETLEQETQSIESPEITTATVEHETQSIESVAFTTSTWKDDLQDKLDETSDKLNATIAANKQQMEQDFTSNLQNELKDFQTTLMSSVENMITKKMEALTIAMQQSFQATVAQAIAQSLQNNNTMEIMPITQPDYNSQTSNTTNNQAQEYNTNKTNNTSIISPNNLKRKNSNGKTNNSTNNINLNGSTTTTKNTNSKLTNAQKKLEAFTETLATNGMSQTQISQSNSES